MVCLIADLFHVQEKVLLKFKKSKPHIDQKIDKKILGAKFKN